MTPRPTDCGDQLRPPRPGDVGPAAGRVVADCAGDVRAILAHLGISRAATWGSSVGGPYALATAALLPEAISSVCLFASLAPYRAPGLDFFEGMSEDRLPATGGDLPLAY